MDPNKMTGEPNQHIHQSVFNFDPYPPTFPVDWNQVNPFARTVPVSPQFGPLGEFPQREIGNAFLRPSSAQSVLLRGVQGTQSVVENPVQQNLEFPPDQQNVPGTSSQYSDSGMFENPVAHSSWAQNPQAPASFSFGDPKPAQDVVQFPFQIVQGFGQRPIRCKRKTNSPPLQQAKQHITEEKMAEHMARLHINSETEAARETESSRMQRLYMCEEMRKLQSDTIIPHSLLTKINQPCRALVLWKPPTRAYMEGRTRRKFSYTNAVALAKMHKRWKGPECRRVLGIEERLAKRENVEKLLLQEANNEPDENENNNAESVPDRENDMESEMNNDNLNNMDMDS